jgi:hypothetical protein
VSTDGKSIGARAALGAINFYRNVISPLRPPACRYTPSCSAFAVEAIERFGVGRGSWLALRRLLRCHPFHRGGHDPVPEIVAALDVNSRKPALSAGSAR